ncbi:MAG: hypothetical protein ACE5IK_05735 [Acidobacteriota bacterium]
MARRGWKRWWSGGLREVSWLLALAFAINAGLVTFGFVARAQEGGAAAGEESPGVIPGESSRASSADLTVLLDEVEGLAEDLDARQAALAEREKNLDAREADIAAREAALAAGGATTPEPASDAEDPFRRLVAAFQGMEPDTSASAMIPLYSRDSTAAIDIILAINSRQAGALMDALASVAPETAAAISHDIYLRSHGEKSAGG